MSKIPFSPNSLCAVLAALGVALPGLAGATEPGADSPDTSARIAELNDTGARAYAERNYRAAIEKFVEAYAIDHDPNLLFNIARCYEKLGDLAASIEKYEAFVAAPGADTEGRVKAKLSLAELKQLRDQGGIPAGEGAPSRAEPASTTSEQTAPTSSSASRSYLPWVTLGAGALVTGVGATFYALGIHDHNQVTNSPGYGNASVVYPMTRAEAQDYVSSGKTKKLVGGIGLGLGGALLATGVVLLITGKSDSADAPERTGLTLGPNLNGFYAGYSGRF